MMNSTGTFKPVTELPAPRNVRIAVADVSGRWPFASVNVNRVRKTDWWTIEAFAPNGERIYGASVKGEDDQPSSLAS